MSAALVGSLAKSCSCLCLWLFPLFKCTGDDWTLGHSTQVISRVANCGGQKKKWSHPPALLDCQFEFALLNFNVRSISLVINKLCCTKSSSLVFSFSCGPSHAGMNRTVILILPLNKPKEHQPVFPSFLSLCAHECESWIRALWATGPPPNPHRGIFRSCSHSWAALCEITDSYLKDIFLLPHTTSEMLTTP